MQQQQQQQPAPPMPAAGAVPPAGITTEQIQKLLDENKQLILAILDNQNLGRLSECAQYQAQLQKNLLYLAAIADSQPPATVRPQAVPHAVMQGGGQVMHPASMYYSQAALQANPQEVQEQQQQRPQLIHQPQMMPFQGHVGLRPAMPVNGMHATMHTEPSHGGGSSEVQPGGPGSSVDGRGSKQDAGAAAPEPTAPAAGASDSQKSSAAESAGGETDPSGYPKRPEDAKTP